MSGVFAPPQAAIRGWVDDFVRQQRANGGRLERKGGTTYAYSGPGILGPIPRGLNIFTYPSGGKGKPSGRRRTVVMRRVKQANRGGMP